MIILIDGYNLLKTIKGSNASLEQRAELLKLLGLYKKEQNHEIIIVFDGGSSSRLTTERQSGLTVMQSGHRFSADHVIIEYVEHHKGKDILLVSADRDLIRQVKIFNIPALDPHTFYHRINKRIVYQEIDEKNAFIADVIKYHDHELPEDKLMYEAIQIGFLNKDDFLDNSSNIIRKNKLSKKDRKKDMIKKKL